jgi:hypothetical protein
MKRAMFVVLTLVVAVTASAQSRSPRQRGGGEPRGGSAVPRTEPAQRPAPSPPPTSSPRPAAEPRRAPTTTSAEGSGRTEGSGGESGSAAARPRQGRPSGGNAVPRGSVPAPRRAGGAVVFVPSGYYGGFWPWGFGGLGFGSYYSGAFDPYYGSYPGYVSGSITGAMRLKIKPRDAQVFVDGFYAGVVDDFDGIFQRLHLDPGAHHIEVRADGYEPLNLDVLISPDQTTKYAGELTKTP